MRALLLAALLLPLAGCVEVDEAWVFERDGSGTYALQVRWNADLLARVRGLVGDKTLAAFEGRAFPLRLEEWREGVRALHGVDVRALSEDTAPGGWRVLSTTLHFGRVEDLLAWEVLARRTIRIDAPDEQRRVHLRMEPFTRLPVLDPLLAAVQAFSAPGPTPAPPPGRAAGDLDPPPLQRAGLPPEQQPLLDRLLGPVLGNVRLKVRVTVAGKVRSAVAPARRAEGAEAEFLWTATDLAPGRTRAVELTYVPGEFDQVPLVQHEGDLPPGAAAAKPPGEGPAGPR